MNIKVGDRLASAVCDTEVIVVRTATAEVDLRCGGEPMVPTASKAAHVRQLVDGDGDGTRLGKRYVDADQTIELLSTKAGSGALAVGEQGLTIRAPKTLPSSD